MELKQKSVIIKSFIPESVNNLYFWPFKSASHSFSPQIEIQGWRNWEKSKKTPGVHLGQWVVEQFINREGTRGKFKMAVQEDPELTSSLRHTKSAATFGAIPSEEKKKWKPAELLLYNKE